MAAGILDSWLPSPINWLAVTIPDLSTLNLLVPPTCKSISNDSPALFVSTMFSLIPVNITLALFHVCVRLTGALLEMLPLAILKFASVPTLVIFGCPAFDTVTAVKADVELPTILPKK